MTFQDIFKSSFLENIASISMLDMAIALVLAFLLGLFIFFVYKKKRMRSSSSKRPKTPTNYYEFMGASQRDRS